MAGGETCSIQSQRTRDRGLRVWVRGARSLHNTRAYWLRIAALVGEQPPRWLLLHDELEGPELNPEQWCALVREMSGLGLESVRIAHVKPSGLAKLEHCEICAREAGFDARAFVDIGVAERWLRYGEAASPD
jgi:hypothetical protein